MKLPGLGLISQLKLKLSAGAQEWLGTEEAVGLLVRLMPNPSHGRGCGLHIYMAFVARSHADDPTLLYFNVM